MAQVIWLIPDIAALYRRPSMGSSKEHFFLHITKAGQLQFREKPGGRGRLVARSLANLLAAYSDLDDLSPGHPMMSSRRSLQKKIEQEISKAAKKCRDAGEIQWAMRYFDVASAQGTNINTILNDRIEQLYDEEDEEDDEEDDCEWAAEPFPTEEEQSSPW